MRPWEPVIGPTTWKSSPILWMDIDRQTIVDRFGAKHDDGVMSHFGPFDAWVLRFPCGLECSVAWIHGHSDIPSGAEIYASACEPAHLLFHLDLAARRWGQSSAEDIVEPTPWRVMRQDDNGNVAIAHRVTTECEARGLAAEYEARGHKQLYWIEHD